MKGYYLVPRKTWQESLHLFTESHYLDTDDPDTILVACDFRSHANADMWEGQEGVENVPHPMMDSSTPIKGKHLGKLKGMGLKTGDKASDIVKKAHGLHSAFKMHRL